MAGPGAPADGADHRLARPARLVPAVVDALVTRIVTGEFAPGTLLPKESDVYEQYGVSRTVVREALRVLEEKGLISIQQGRGTVALGPDSWNLLDPLVIAALVRNDPSFGVVEELVDVRAAMESEMARVAAQRITAGEKAELTDALRALEQSLDDHQRYLTLDRDFHDVIMRASRNRFGRRIVKEVFAWTRRAPDHTVGDAHIAKAHADHSTIHRLILSGQAEKAAAAMRRHILDNWAATRQRFLESQTAPRKRTLAPRG